MPSAIVFSRGRITLPREVCDDLGIGPGSKIEFVENADGETIMRAYRPDSGDVKAIDVNDDAQSYKSAALAAVMR